MITLTSKGVLVRLTADELTKVHQIAKDTFNDCKNRHTGKPKVMMKSCFVGCFRCCQQ